MSRWQPGAADRLERAALELFLRQGFAETTVPQIAERAGVTTRTFFRHFPDKREVLFSYDQELPGVVAELMAGAPASITPLDEIARSLRIVAETRLADAYDYLRVHREIVRSDPGLQEREAQKNAVLAEAVRRGFLAMGHDELAATLSAHLAVTVLTVSINRWLDLDGALALPELLDETLATVRSLTATN